MANIAGTPGDDLLQGDAEFDTFEGAGGVDQLQGGPGGDLFVLQPGDSAATAALGAPDVLDMITDWSAVDRILFEGGDAVGAATLLQASAVDYDAAYALAMDAYATQGMTYAAVQVGADVFVFAMRLDQAVRLASASVADVADVSFTTGSLAADGGISESGSAGDDTRALGIGADHYDGGLGADSLSGGAGGDTLAGGSGDDLVEGNAGPNHLRGDDGSDLILGGDDFDSINGNVGNDAILAGGGDDWARGGKGDDVVLGQAGNDLVFGDFGNDTLSGGDGDDAVTGGDGNDHLMGDAGADTLSGESGADTLEGGDGGDTFIATEVMQTDVVLDFDAASGDHVHVEDGAVWVAYQMGADTVVQVGGDAHLVLAGVDLASLPADWIDGGQSLAAVTVELF